MVARRSRNGRENIKISRCGPCSLAGRRWEWSPPPARRKTTWWISRCWTYPCHPSRHPPISRSSLNDRGNSEGTTTRRHRCHVVAMPWNVRVRLSGVVHPLPRSCSLLVGDRDSSLPLCPLDKVGRWRRRIRKFVGDFQGSLKSRMDSRCGKWWILDSCLFIFVLIVPSDNCVRIYIYIHVQENRYCKDPFTRDLNSFSFPFDPSLVTRDSNFISFVSNRDTRAWRYSRLIALLFFFLIETSNQRVTFDPSLIRVF